MFSRKQWGKNSGFTLVEIAIGIMILGILLVPAATMYSLYLQNISEDQNQSSVLTANSAVDGYLSLYGRYPCPAPMDAAYDSDDYGYSVDDCSIDVDGSIEVVTGTGGRNVAIGSLPFREMNLSERDAYDGHNNRLTYAVTVPLTNASSFIENLGAIDIVDISDQSLVQPAGSAHYVVVSSGKNTIGGVSREGSIGLACDDNTVPEFENCDHANAVFRYALTSNSFDDIVRYGASSGGNAWQFSSVPSEENDIHLRSSSGVEGIAVGLANADVGLISDPAELEILQKEVGDPNAYLVAEEGGVLADEVCDDSGNCFNPSLIGGASLEGEGLRCPANQFLIAVQNGQPVCSNEIEFNCPPGQRMIGIGSNGELLCDTDTTQRCPDESITTLCGHSRDLANTIDGGYLYTYSGDCYRHPLDNVTVRDEAETKTTIEDLRAYVADLRDPDAHPRTHEDCGPDASKGLVRETWQCSGGTWSRAKAHERYYTTPSFPSDPYHNGNAWRAETSYGYTPTASVENLHGDCWCREDYRLREYTCHKDPTNPDAKRVRIQKFYCPQNDRRYWQSVFYDPDTFCQCNPHTKTTYSNCHSYFGVSSTSMSGVVNIETDYTCSDDDVLTQDGDPRYDISDCACPSKPTLYNVTDCAEGQTNDGFFLPENGTTYPAGTHSVTRQNWICPSGSPFSAANAGYYETPVLLHEENCECDTELAQPVHVDCPPNEDGPGYDYMQPWNCALNAYDPDPATWQLVGGSCNTCSWKKPAGSPERSEFAGDHKAGTMCDCRLEPTSCYENAPGGDYDVYYGCTCEP